MAPDAVLAAGAAANAGTHGEPVAWHGCAVYAAARRPVSRAAAPALSSDQYAREYNEVKALGGLADGKRRPDQTQLATFYASNYFILVHQVLRDVAAWRTDNIGDNARLFRRSARWQLLTRLLSRGIASRPMSTGDRSRRSTRARMTVTADVGDPSWQPFLNTPNYPECTSGANGAVGALTRRRWSVLRHGSRGLHGCQHQCKCQAEDTHLHPPLWPGVGYRGGADLPGPPFSAARMKCPQAGAAGGRLGLLGTCCGQSAARAGRVA